MECITSINLGNFLKDYNLPDSLKAIKDAGFDGVDFSLWYYSQKDDAPLRQDNWREWTQHARGLLEQNELCVPQAHAHWRHDGQLEKDFSFRQPDELIHRNIEACRILGCDKLVFHPIQHFFPIENEQETRQKVLDANVQWFSALLPTAERFGVQLLIENMFDYQHVQSPDAPQIPMASGEDLLYVIEKINHPLVQICLDTGHANIAGSNIPAMIRLWGDHLRALHLQDNYGKIYPIYEDIHQFPGTCDIDWKEVFLALKETNCDVTLNMELSARLAGQPYEIQKIRLSCGREVLLKMAEIYMA